MSETYHDEGDGRAAATLPVVDAVLGIQKVVLKQLEGPGSDCPLYQAAAVMGDGTVAMVLNVDALQVAAATAVASA